MDRILRTEGISDRKVIVIGTTFLDIKGYPLGEFVPDGRNAGRIEYRAGGVGRNVAADLAGLGFEPRFLSALDDSPGAARIEEELKRAGIGTEYCIRSGQGIGIWLAIFDDRGNVHSNISQRVDLSPLAGLLDEKGEEIFAGAAGIMLEMDAGGEVVPKTMALAEKMNIPVFGVISNMLEGRDKAGYIEKTACFVCNAVEAGQLFRTETEGLTPEEFLSLLTREVKKRGMRSMIVTLDKRGAVYASADGQSGLCAAKDIRPVDTAGAGDAFFSGAAAALLSGHTLSEACGFGTDIASEVLMTRENVYRREE